MSEGMPWPHPGAKLLVDDPKNWIPKSPPIAVGKLATKIAEVVKAVGWVEKRGRNDQQGYNYVTEADVLAAVRGELADRHVVILPTVDSAEHWEIARDNRPPLRVTRVWVTFTFVDGETGETLERRFPGDGMDSGDKGIYKALTGAEKYLLTKTFMLPTGDDPEEDEDAGGRGNTTPPRTPAAPSSAGLTPGQVKFLEKACKEQGWQPNDLAGRFGAETIAAIPAAEFNAAMAAVRGKAK